MFVQGRIYRRRGLHDTYGGQWQGGISTPADESFIFLFTGEIGEAYGYKDRWTDEGLFLYTGEGQEGDMTFVRGNRAIRDHMAEGKDLYLFEYARQGYVRYIGEMVCIGHHERQGHDVHGHDRKILVFELAPSDSLTSSEDGELPIQGKDVSAAALKRLRKKALTTTATGVTPSQRLTDAFARSEAVRTYVLARADGTCEACRRPAPFTTAAGRPYLETHHIRRLSDAGLDDPKWVIALCPNCHRRAHYGSDKSAFKKHASQIVRERELQVANQ